MILDLTPCQNAIARLEEMLAPLQREPENEAFRDSVVKRFEFTYELTRKMLWRFLSLYGGDAEEVAGLTFPQLLRAGNQQHLLRSDWERWHDFRDIRNKTSHTYDRAVADDVLGMAPEFLEEARLRSEHCMRKLLSHE